jgi:hypothetical protein
VLVATKLLLEQIVEGDNPHIVPPGQPTRKSANGHYTKTRVAGEMGNFPPTNDSGNRSVTLLPLSRVAGEATLNDYASSPAVLPDAVSLG